MDLDKAIQNRRCVRKFNPKKKPDWRTIIECIDSARYAPMAGGNYTLKFILVSDEEKINRIAKACQQDFVAQAKFVVVVCSNPARTINLYGKKGGCYAKYQAGAAVENFFLKIIESGLSTCWVGHFVEGQIKEILKIPEDTDVDAVFPIGYELEKPMTRKAKIDLDRILYFNRYGNVQMKKEEGGVE
ncbi:MAG: nitroreductase family protein [Candidatus Nanoarchaeia archaeon]|nr:nitroreductase family protein [Candidatus Nanoarchaeia archaeon]MDD5357999.1 nitroreductase family protein [Candidatus Nanoarchaeia archaeon]MDD5588918.1 nitroreductase family protein [Candidatus Nanoarchaeia archaeon]